MILVFDPFLILFGLVWYSGMRKWYAKLLIYSQWSGLISHSTPPDPTVAPRLLGFFDLPRGSGLHRRSVSCVGAAGHSSTASLTLHMLEGVIDASSAFQTVEEHGEAWHTIHAGYNAEQRTVCHSSEMYSSSL